MKRNFVSLVVCLAFIAVFAVPAALAPAATTAPTVTSITPNNLGNGKGNKAAPVIISGTNFLPGERSCSSRAAYEAEEENRQGNVRVR